MRHWPSGSNAVRVIHVEDERRLALLAAHRETVVAVIDAGRTVARAWPEDRVADSRAVTGPLSTLLERRGLDADLLALLADAAAATGETIQGQAVPAPPYLVVTSRGPVCRATLSEGRLVVTLALFEVGRRPRRYRFLDPDPETCLRIELV